MRTVVTRLLAIRNSIPSGVVGLGDLRPVLPVGKIGQFCPHHPARITVTLPHRPLPEFARTNGKDRSYAYLDYAVNAHHSINPARVMDSKKKI